VPAQYVSELSEQERKFWEEHTPEDGGVFDDDPRVSMRTTDDDLNNLWNQLMEPRNNHSQATLQAWAHGRAQRPNTNYTQESAKVAALAKAAIQFRKDIRTWQTLGLTRAEAEQYALQEKLDKCQKEGNRPVFLRGTNAVLVLEQFAKGQSTVPSIASETGISPKSVRNAVADAVARGDLIEVDKIRTGRTKQLTPRYKITGRPDDSAGGRRTLATAVSMTDKQVSVQQSHRQNVTLGKQGNKIEFRFLQHLNNNPNTSRNLKAICTSGDATYSYDSASRRYIPRLRDKGGYLTTEQIGSELTWQLTGKGKILCRNLDKFPPKEAVERTEEEWQRVQSGQSNVAVVTGEFGALSLTTTHGVTTGNQQSAVPESFPPPGYRTTAQQQQVQQAQESLYQPPPGYYEQLQDPRANYAAMQDPYLAVGDTTGHTAGQYEQQQWHPQATYTAEHLTTQHPYLAAGDTTGHTPGYYEQQQGHPQATYTYEQLQWHPQVVPPVPAAYLAQMQHQETTHPQYTMHPREQATQYLHPTTGQEFPTSTTDQRTYSTGTSLLRDGQAAGDFNRLPGSVSGAGIPPAKESAHKRKDRTPPQDQQSQKPRRR
jgi:hypothetical protein